ncbi:MAG: HAMP domain-containing protein [gamma proteobacterium symbiont of Lucinoma myriamae]|nr:HAMP domain-containing protein [gamma proteobacterium symbiont of Lucinoma myriamae]MCU7818571.1 HAMP domain-containing protein [gamma proteobacterium symbiont of Lucinoma myriamae]MCU7832923.1 HAMP domain-containing protein [gamma proteobacterium symbiont of Lucinoma myriamae]
MQLEIKSKLIIALLVINGILAFSIYYFNSSSFDKEFLAYINRLQEAKLQPMTRVLASGYDKYGHWNWITRRPRVWNYLQQLYRSGALESTTLETLLSEQNFQTNNQEHPFERQSRRQSRRLQQNSDRPIPPGRKFGRPVPEASIELSNVFLRDQNQRLLIGSRKSEHKVNWLNIFLDDKLIGQVGYMPRTKLSQQVDLYFAQQQKESFATIAVYLVIIALFIAIVLSRHFLQPIRSLSKGVHQLVCGNYKQTLLISSKDELGQLAHDFNHLSKTLEQNRQDRRQWIVDISHELRTPVAILQGEIEALLDNVRPLNHDALQSLQHETKRLKRLISDLHKLSMSDLGAQSYKMENIDLLPRIKEFIDDNEAQLKAQGLDFIVTFHCQKAMVYADEGRIEQLLVNLMQNSLRYTNTPGQIKLTVSHGNQMLIINWSDSSPGVQNNDLARLFERLYRVDASRNRASGGSGLGLAICLNIAQAHNGSISASHSELGGLNIQLKLPLIRT